MKFLGFDLETATWPDDNNWDRQTLLGISCIGVMGTGWDKPEVYYASACSGSPEPRGMNQDELNYFADDLKTKYKDYTLVTWNGLQFDWLVLALENPENKELYKFLAMHHIDPMFYILCSKGWPVSLNAVAHGLGLPGKMTEGVSGADAPKMWMEGTKEDREKVLEYVGQDAVTTLDIIEVANRTKTLKWQSKSGRWQSLYYSQVPSVLECLGIPEPDTSWMSNPLTRKSFYDWTEG